MEINTLIKKLNTILYNYRYDILSKDVFNFDLNKYISYLKPAYYGLIFDKQNEDSIKYNLRKYHTIELYKEIKEYLINIIKLDIKENEKTRKIINFIGKTDLYLFKQFLKEYKKCGFVKKIEYKLKNN